MGLLLLPFYFFSSKWPGISSKTPKPPTIGHDHRVPLCPTGASAPMETATLGQISHTPCCSPPIQARLLRRHEDTRPNGAAGRMVISGSMAAVCAELDRLIQLENHGPSSSVH